MTEADDAALRAERESGVTLRLLAGLDQISQVRRLVDDIWQPEHETDPPIWTELIRALTHSGNYLAGAFAQGELVGASLGFFGAGCGGMLETGIGRAGNVALAALPGFTLPGDTSASDRYYDQDITAPFVLRAGHVNVPDGPGLGVTLLDDVLAEVTTSTEWIAAGS